MTPDRPIPEGGVEWFSDAPEVVTPDRPIPESLSATSLQPLWAAARLQLDRHGPERRGVVARPEIDSASALALESLLGRPLTKRLDLYELEAALVGLKVGDDLSEALSRLGHPPSPAASQRRADRERSKAARAGLERAVATWEEPWASEWADGVVRAGLLGGLDDGDAAHLAASVRRLLDRLDQADASGAGRTGLASASRADLVVASGTDASVAGRADLFGASRTELAAGLFGSSHALDPGTRLASFVSHALRHRIGESLEGRELWDASGVQADRVSAPVLAWSVPAVGDSALDEMIRAAAGGGLPLHISLLAMLRHPVSVPVGAPVLVVENPRLVEAAAERTLPTCVVAANGNPTTAVTMLLRQMQQSGASIWYHGDFDAAGIAICRRMHEAGCTPWMMNASDYEDAADQAEVHGVQLARDSKDCGPTPWDPALRTVFERERFIVHEEFLLDSVLDKFSRMTTES